MPVSRIRWGRLLVLAAAVSVAGCTKDIAGPTGATGAQGPAGVAGPEGPAGPAGPQGPAGPEGPAGVQGPAGDPGSTGATGAAGPMGPAGAPGANGLTALVKTSAEDPGMNCLAGGFKVEVGLDQNANGTLDDGEIDSANTRYLCNGSQGLQGPQGDPGVQGLPGIQGPEGPQGPAGSATLALTSPEPVGANCAFGGTKLELGTDGNGDGILDPTEVNSALTSYVCNGAMGLQGPSGATGPIGATGPQGPSGVLGIYGDGSAGQLSVASGTTLDLTTVAGFNALGPNHHLQFSSIDVAGTLIVPSGTILRSTGDVTVSGTINVEVGAMDDGNGPPNPGVSRAAPGALVGGVGLSPIAASQLTRPTIAAGGAGDRTNAVASGGEGGGSLVIAAMGNVTIVAGGVINANGNNGVNPTGFTDIGGGGGGAGGVVVRMG